MELPIYDFDQLSHFLDYKGDSIYVINFWATWCKPCVAELPHFESINKKYKSSKIEVILVSLDFPQDLDKRLLPFLEENNLASRILLLNERDPNSWIPKINEDWSGAIPATIFVGKGKKLFHEGSLTENEIKSFIKKLN